MPTYSYSGNKKHKKKQNHASEYLPYLINELADEIEVVEQVLSRGEEGQVLTANSNGKAQWADSLNDIQDEIEIVEQVLSGGEEGQVLTADSNGKAQWAAGGGVFYDDVQIANVLAGGVNTTTVTFLLNGEKITNLAWFVYILENDEEYIYRFFENGTTNIVTGQAGAPEYRLYILLTTGEVRILDLENEAGGPPPG